MHMACLVQRITSMCIEGQEGPAYDVLTDCTMGERLVKSRTDKGRVFRFVQTAANEASSQEENARLRSAVQKGRVSSHVCVCVIKVKCSKRPLDTM